MGSTKSWLMRSFKAVNRLFEPRAVPKEKILFDFSKPLEAPWMPASDNAFNGTSHCNFQTVQEGDENFAQFSGFISRKQKDENNTFPFQHKLGFCCVQTNFTQPLNLVDYQGFEAMIRGDGRIYSLNVQSEGYLPIYFQVAIATPPNEWHKVSMLFRNFINSSHLQKRGHDSSMPSQFIESLSFSLRDDVEGDFKFDIKYLKAINDPAWTERFERDEIEKWNTPEGRNFLKTYYDKVDNRINGLGPTQDKPNDQAEDKPNDQAEDKPNDQAEDKPNDQAENKGKEKNE